MGRFVILEHDHPHRHWDLMLEAGDRLRTWRLAAPPADEITVDAEAAPDHRHAYLDYEGPVSGGRGTVVRWDAGTFTTELDEPERLVVVLAGGRYCGRVCLSCDAEGSWTLKRMR